MSIPRQTMMNGLQPILGAMCTSTLESEACAVHECGHARTLPASAVPLIVVRVMNGCSPVLHVAMAFLADGTLVDGDVPARSLVMQITNRISADGRTVPGCFLSKVQVKVDNLSGVRLFQNSACTESFRHGHWTPSGHRFDALL
jgi:hypothetical protein